VLEEYLLNGKAPDRDTKEGAIAIPGLKHLPQPGQAIVEGGFTWELPDRPYDVRGIIDCHDYVDGVPRIIDHKTTGDFKWARTPAQLREDTQATVYAGYAMHASGSDRVLGRWVYYRTRGRPAAKAVDWETDTTIIEAPLQRFFASCDQMVRIQAAGAKALDLDPEVAACDRYGGCPFRDRCNLSSKERFRAFMAQQTLKEKMAARAAGKAKPEPEVNPPEAAQQDAPLEGGDKPQQGALSLMDKMKARRAEQGEAEETKPAPVSETKVEPATPDEAPEKKAKSKTMKEKMAERAGKKKAAAKTEPAQPEAEKADGKPLVPETRVPESVDMQGFEALFVDCAPLKGSFQTLPLSNLLAECNGDVGAYLDANPLPEGYAVTMTMATPEGKAAFEALSARANVVVRGL